MKRFEDLTEAEKNKLLIYSLVRANTNRHELTFMLGGIIFFAIGIPLAMSSVLQASLIGVTMVLIGSLLFIVVMLSMVKADKYLQLAFDINSSMKDLFKIKKSDIMDMERRWVKIEDKEEK